MNSFLEITFVSNLIFPALNWRQLSIKDMVEFYLIEPVQGLLSANKSYSRALKSIKKVNKLINTKLNEIDSNFARKMQLDISV